MLKRLILMLIKYCQYHNFKNNIISLVQVLSENKFKVIGNVVNSVFFVIKKKYHTKMKSIFVQSLHGHTEIIQLKSLNFS
jgi:hypothetical protein